MATDLRQTLPFLDWPEIWRQQIHWAMRDISGDKAEALKRDMVDYLDWASAFVKGETKDLPKGYELHANVCRWKPEDFPLKEPP